MWVARRSEGVRRRIRDLGFGTRLFAALALAAIVVGTVAYLLISDRLEQAHVDDLARATRADAASFEQTARSLDRRIALREIDEQLEGIGRRPGTTEASLIAPDGTIVASSDDGAEGSRDLTPQIQAATESGISRYGREVDPAEDSSDFEFVTPVEVPGGRHALEMSFDEETFQSQLAEIRRTMILVGTLGLLLGGALFYVLGGRSLLRSHRLATQRATLDGLTDLPNQRAFQLDLEQASALAGRRDDPLSLAVFDLDHFKLVNDRYGHPQGDALLKRVASLLEQRRSADRAYRVGGDEFALLLPNTDVAGAQVVLRQLIRRFGDADAAVSIGCATMRSGEGWAQLRGEADAALYEAKRRGGRRHVHFADLRGDVAVSTSEKREAAERLIREGRLRTVFQPIWDFGSGRLIGVEALTRPAPDYGFSGPAELFDVANELGIVHELDRLCASRALAAVDPAQMPADTLVFINLAPRTLEQDAGIDDWLKTAVEGSGLDPEGIVVEVTERLGSRIAPVIKSLSRLREQGFHLALDDVGTGNAGLEMLRKVDADFVKIDRSIVAAAPTEPNARAVLLAMATFAAQTGAFVIAEGIEDEETLEFLRGIDASKMAPGHVIQGGQGFKLGRPESELCPEQPQILRPSAGANWRPRPKDAESPATARLS